MNVVAVRKPSSVALARWHRAVSSLANVLWLELPRSPRSAGASRCWVPGPGSLCVGREKPLPPPRLLLGLSAMRDPGRGGSARHRARGRASAGSGAAAWVPSPGSALLQPPSSSSSSCSGSPLGAVRKNRLTGKPEWHFSVKSYVNLAPSFFVVLIGLPRGGLFSHTGKRGLGVGQCWVRGLQRGRGHAGARGSTPCSLLCQSTPAQRLGAALGSMGPCRSPSEAKEPGREPQANLQQPRADRDLGARGSPRALPPSAGTPPPRALLPAAARRLGQPRMAPCCAQAAELQGAETLVGRETWRCSHITATVHPGSLPRLPPAPL